MTRCRRSGHCPDPGRSTRRRCLVSGRRLLLAAGLGLAAAAAQATVADPETEAERALRTLLREEAQSYEDGAGVERDPVRAAALYCKAARLGDPQAQFNLGWMYASGRGVERSDGTAAYFFHAAAEQGWAQAVEMLSRVGGPPSYVPDCMRDPAPPKLALPAPAPRPNRAPIERPRIDAPAHIVATVRRLAPQYQLDPQLVLAFAKVESNFDTVALSPKNAKGLMQLIPETAERFGVRQPYDVEQNLRGGMSYLRWLLAYFEGNVLLAAAAYNAGEGAVNRYRGVPPYAETRAYVSRILTMFGDIAHPFDASVTTPSPQLRTMTLLR